MPIPNKYIIVVTAALQEASNNWVKTNADTVGGENTFTNGLSASGEEPATHYWCNWRLDDSYKDNVLTWVSNGNPNVQKFDVSEYTNQQVLDELGLKVIESNT